MKYRKKPIEAFRFGYDPIPDWFESYNYNSQKLICDYFTESCLSGDFIVKEGRNIYPIKYDIFIATYEAVE